MLISATMVYNWFHVYFMINGFYFSVVINGFTISGNFGFMGLYTVLDFRRFLIHDSGD